jgi:hypothetical protein
MRRGEPGKKREPARRFDVGWHYVAPAQPEEDDSGPRLGVPPGGIYPGQDRTEKNAAQIRSPAQCHASDERLKSHRAVRTALRRVIGVGMAVRRCLI